MMTKNIFIAGVGGQGILTVSSIIADSALARGFDVKKSEVHGMAQRGGSVVSHVRYGDKIHSPLIDPGEANILLAFEKLEAARYLEYLRKEGVLIVNDQRILPSSTSDKPFAYPDNIEASCRRRCRNVYLVPALDAARQLGNVKIANIVMLGAFSAFASEIPLDVWKRVITENVPQKFLEINLRGFAAGMEMATQMAH